MKPSQLSALIEGIVKKTLKEAWMDKDNPPASETGEDSPAIFKVFDEFEDNPAIKAATDTLISKGKVLIEHLIKKYGVDDQEMYDHLSQIDSGDMTIHDVLIMHLLFNREH